MADLDEMLLEAAGVTGRNQHSPPPSRRRRKGSYSDDGSNSRDDDSDDDRAYAGRKPSASQVPLKKRLDPAEHDDEHSSSRDDEDDDDDDDDKYDHERDSDDDSVGSDLYKGEEDRKRLAKMSELDREMELAARATKRDDKNLKDTIKKQKEKSNQSRKDSPPHTGNRVRYSTRSAPAAAATAKGDALDLIRNNRNRKKKQRQQDPEAHLKRRDTDSAVIGKEYTSKRANSGTQSDDDNSAGDMGNSEDENSNESSVLTYEDIKGITIRRSKLAKLFMEPFFEELIIGCFVRVGIGKSKSGPIYRLCIVRNVDAVDPDRQYKLENKMTHKYLNVVWGNENSSARWQMAMISDSPPLKEEFDQLMREVDRHEGRMPSKEEVMEKREAIEKTNSFVYSAETVKQMLQEKKSTIRRPLNVAAEKDRLRRDMEVAQMRHDDVEVEKIKAKLLELEASRQGQMKDKKAIRLAEMNRKNRVENFKNASEMKPVNTGLKAGEAGYDPFSRRWTRSRNYYVSKPGEAGAGEANAQTGAGGGPKAGLVATAAALEAAADAGKLVDTNAPDQGTESNMLHDFDLPISLAALQKFGGAHGVQAGFMSRKQRIEATVGCRVPENDWRRHALTLSVSDYKRRRGVKSVPGNDGSSEEILLQVQNMIKDVPIRILSDDDFNKEEVDDLCQRVKDGLIKRPIVVEVEHKARLLHEDITKHWIPGELTYLRNLIDRADEKGWRKEYSFIIKFRETSVKSGGRLIRHHVAALTAERQGYMHQPLGSDG